MAKKLSNKPSITTKIVNGVAYSVHTLGMHVQVFNPENKKVYDNKLSKKKLPDFWETCK